MPHTEREQGKAIRRSLRILRILPSRAVEIRIPLIPGYNDGAIDAIGALLATYSNITKVRVLKYHNMAQSKYASLGNDHTLPALSEDDCMERSAEILRGYGLNVIV